MPALVSAARCHIVLPQSLRHLLLQFIMAEGAKSRLRRDEMRTVVAHIFRLTANNMPPGTLRQQPAVCSRMLEFISDTLRYLQTGTSGEFKQLQDCSFTQLVRCSPQSSRASDFTPWSCLV